MDEDSLDFLNGMILREPDNAKLYYLRANIQYEQSQIFYALADIERAKKLNPDSDLLSEIYSLEGNAELARLNYPEALNSYNLAIRFNENNIKAYLGKARYLLFRSDNLSDVKFLDNSIQRFPDNQELIVLRSMLYLKFEKFDESEKDLEYIRSNFDTTHVQLIYSCHVIGGRISMFRKEYLVAKNELEQAISIDSSAPNIHGLLGESNYNLGDYDAAMKNFESAINLGIRNPLWDISLANIYEMKGHIDKACEIYLFRCEVPAMYYSKEIASACRKYRKLKCRKKK